MPPRQVSLWRWSVSGRVRAYRHSISGSVMACWRVELMQQMKPSIPERPVLVLGAGGHARVVAATLLEAGRRLLGYIDTDVSLWGTASLGGIVLGGDERLSDFSPLEIGLANGIGSVRQPTVRRMVFEQGRRLGFLSRQSFIHGPACRPMPCWPKAFRSWRGPWCRPELGLGQTPSSTAVRWSTTIVGWVSMCTSLRVRLSPGGGLSAIIAT